MTLYISSTGALGIGFQRLEHRSRMAKSLSRRRSNCKSSGRDTYNDVDIESLIQPDDFCELAMDAFQCLHEKESTSVSFAHSCIDTGSVRTVQDVSDDRQQTLRALNGRNILQVFSLFGFKKDDRTHRRDQVKMWTQIREAMNAEIDELTRSGKVENYDRAKNLYQALNSIRKGFEALQMEELQRQQNEELNTFEKACKKLQASLTENEVTRLSKQERFEQKRKEDLLYQQAIERENLAHRRTITRPPKERLSKRILELQKAEIGLTKLDRFDEAKNVRRMIDTLVIPETRKARMQTQKRLEQEHQQLETAQEEQSKRLHKRLETAKWRAFRRSEREVVRQQQRIKNLRTDMSHANVLDTCRKPEIVFRPSALLQKRAHHALTSSSHNGTRLLDNVLGKSAKEAIYVAPLCANHQFEHALPDTRPYSG